MFFSTLKTFLARFFASNFRLRVLFLSLLLLSLIGLLVSLQADATIPYCYTNEFLSVNETIKEESKVLLANNIKYERLTDVLTDNFQPVQGQSIFFHETSCSQVSETKLDERLVEVLRANGILVNEVQLTARQACAIESTALHNSNSEVFILFASPDYLELHLDSNLPTDPIIAAILSYKNVHMRYLNLWAYAKNTPMYELLQKGQLFKSRFLLSHVSDFLRYLTLWIWGGTYLDMDIINLRSFENLPPNFTGAESNNALAAGVMNLAADGIGREIAYECLLDFHKNFNGKDWGNNGPGVITRVIQKVCGTKHITEMLALKQCKGFNIFARDAFYAVPWLKWAHFFEAEFANKTLEDTKNSYVIHVWNKYSKSRLIRKQSNAAYELLAKQHCPKVYAAINEYF